MRIELDDALEQFLLIVLVGGRINESMIDEMLPVIIEH